MKLIGAFLMKLWSAQAFSSYFHKMTILVFRFSPKSKGFFHSRSSMAVSIMNLIRASGVDPGFGNGGGGKISSQASYIYEQSELRATQV